VLPELLAGADLPAWCRRIAELRRQLTDLLDRHGLHPDPGAANYLWIPDAAGLRERLLPRGVLIRSGASFGAPDAVRIAVPTSDGLARLDEAMEQTQP
jgi:histidinol-phosphate/aromatic aminotransferase/cobyric acid decarboxylase-like protein